MALIKDSPVSNESPVPEYIRRNVKLSVLFGSYRNLIAVIAQFQNRNEERATRSHTCLQCA